MQSSHVCGQERESELAKETKRQERNEELRKMFAQHTNSFHSWLTDCRTALMDGRGTLEEQLAAVKVGSQVRGTRRGRRRGRGRGREGEGRERKEKTR